AHRLARAVGAGRRGHENTSAPPGRSCRPGRPRRGTWSRGTREAAMASPVGPTAGIGRRRGEPL
ncbi:MAG: hypothetical protein AVDCRST_MAG49-1601, partial [uncultured Thermomicrobiales bacterium]